MIETELTKGAKLIQQKQLFEACDFFEQLLKRFPKDSRPASNLAVAYLMVGEKKRAVEMFQYALKLSPKSPDLWYNLATCLAEIGDLQNASKSAQESLRLNPRFQQASQLLAKIASINTSNSTTQQPLTQQNPVQKEQHLTSEQAYQLAVKFFQERKFHDAQTLIQKLLQAEPTNKNALNVLGAIYFENREYKLAKQLMEKLNAQYPNDSIVLCNLGKSYSKLVEHTAANEVLQQAIELDPENDEARRELAFSLVYSGLGLQAMHHYEVLLSKNPEDLVSASNLVYLLTWLGIYPQEELTKRHKSLGETYRKIAQRNPLNQNANHEQISASSRVEIENRKIRLGYISPDFRYHSVHLFFEGIMENHDRSKFDLCFYSNVEFQDDATTKYQQNGNFRDVNRMSDRDAAALIRQDQVDILIDLAGHTSKTRLPVLAYKPAPLQCSFLGYPNTTGMEDVDHFITDEFCDPYGKHDEHFVEKLIRLDQCKYVYRPRVSFPEVGPLPSLSGAPFTFGCFNNPSKYNDHVLKLWADLLNAIPDARLLLKAKWFLETAMTNSLRNRFAAVGGDTIRLLMHDYTDSTDDLDLALDPFPFNGATTTCQALWMGLPVLTTIGDTHICRRSYSIQNSMGLNDFCAENHEHFIEIAKDWTTRRNELSTIRHTLRERFNASPLRDELGLTRKLESALVQALKAKHCNH